MKHTKRILLAGGTMLVIAGAALAAVVTVTEPRPETTDGREDLLRKICHSLNEAANTLEN